jgi:uncharacterized repeat protein (TIGR02543 family)
MNFKRTIAGFLAIFMIAVQVPQAQLTAFAAEDFDVHENENTTPVVTSGHDEGDHENCDGHDHEHIDGQQPGGDAPANENLNNQDPTKEKPDGREPGNPEDSENNGTPDDTGNPDDANPDTEDDDNDDNDDDADDQDDLNDDDSDDGAENEEAEEIIIEQDPEQLPEILTASDFQYDYTVTFDVNGGDEEVVSFGYNKGDTVAFETPVREGYVFAGWYTDARFRTKITGITARSASSYDLIAKWTPIKYTIIFNKNDASNSIKATGSTANLAMTYDVEKKLNVNRFARKGYTFGGWMKNADGAETEGELIDFEDAEAVINLATENNAKVKLYAYWVPIEYTITYNLNGSENSAENPATYTAEDTIALAAPTTNKAGFVFDGWYKENTYKTKVTEIKAGTTGNLTFYAKWITGEFKVNYDANGGSGKMTPDTFKYGVEKALKVNAFKKSVTETINGKKVNKNYVFAGWSVVPADGYDSSEEYFRDKQVVDSNILLEMLNVKGLLRGEVNDNTTFENGEVTLYAVWRRDYTVSFDTMCDVEAPETISYSYGDTVKLPTVAREGYTFAGWYTDNTYKTKIASIARNAATDYVLAAKWTPNKHTVIFNKNAKDATGSMANLALVYDTEKELTANKFVRKGYKFTGWSTTADGSGFIFDDGETVKNLIATNNGKVTLYAQWQATGYTITFDTNGGSAVEAVTYQFNAAAPLTLNVQNPVKDRYVFTGWYTDAACKKIVKNNQLSKGTSGDITLYAGWKLDAAVETFYITYYVDGTAVSYGDDYAQYNYSKTATFLLPEPEAKAGYTFAGWYKDSALKSKLGTTIPKNTKGDLQLYAKWNSVNYKVSFDLNKPAEVPANVKPSGRMNPQTLSYGQSKALTKSSFAIKGYKFLGWRTESGTPIANQQKITGQEFGDYTATVTLYAQWEKETYTITYVDPAAATNTNPTTYSVTDAVTLENLSQFGNTFQGWYTDKNCKKKATGITAGTTGNKTFYAKWYTMQKVSGLHFIHNYQWSETETETATLRQNSCTVCGLIKETEVICKHSWDDGTVIKNAKCGVAGTMKYTCVNCGTNRTETIPALDHNWQFHSQTDATCDKAGRIVERCTVCKGTKTEPIPALGHNYKAAGTRESTCTEEGYTESICENCGDVKRTVLEKSAHDYIEVRTEPTCTRTGLSERKCSVCGHVDSRETLQVTEHNYEWITITEPTKRTWGMERYVCTDCGAVSKNHWIDPLPCEHVWVTIVSKEATCTEGGYYEKECSECGMLSYGSSGPEMHRGSWVTIKEATLTSEGLERLVCDTCGQVVEERTTGKLRCPHPQASQLFIEEEPATCNWYATGKLICTECDTVIYSYEVNIEGGYDYDNHGHFTETIEEPTVYKEGRKLKVCDDCGYSYVIETIPKLECNHESTHQYVIRGALWEICDICDEKITMVRECQHNSKFLKEKADGNYEEYCQYCDAFLRIVPLTEVCNHFEYPVKEIVHVEADADTWGEYDYVCSNCGKIMDSIKVHPYQAFTVYDATGSEITVYGWLDHDAAHEVASLTSEYRIENGLNGLSYNESLQAASDLRAIEISVLFSHTRPNNTQWGGVHPNFARGSGENIASGQSSASRVMNAWKNSEGHNQNMLFGSGLSGKDFDTPTYAFRGISVGCFHQFEFTNPSKPHMVKETKHWVQNFTMSTY